MAGLFKKITSYVLGGGDENTLNGLLDKLNAFKSDNVRLYYKHPQNSALIEVYKNASASFQYNEKSGKFGVLVQNLAPYNEDDDDDEEIQMLLPITKTVQWEIYSPQSDDDNYACGHIFDYSKKKEKGVEDGIYQLEFTNKEKTTVIDEFENLVNDVLDHIDKQVCLVNSFTHQAIHTQICRIKSLN
jgi:hypothetical protein